MAIPQRPSPGATTAPTSPLACNLISRARAPSP
ncbi:hypothetical protein E2C01_082067 [Portunus trituberculatus]|uniref:Uncharacterized protein n=1 Tax=Portunus trituberculatus TaxID=210409 RepID=A0A5B7INZ8_PORTR|nr:hypothetical protein [Portunus trituberculatus]